VFTICAHCLLPISGYGSPHDGQLCHPDVPGMDCYRLVTVHQHEMPCHREPCLASADIRRRRESNADHH
jgi:hypothetical protein